MNRLISFRTGVCIIRRSMCTPAAPSGPPHSTPTSSNISINPKYRPSEFQKFILVWTKKFKSKEEVPDFVSPDLIDRSQSQARIKIANILMLLTALASFGAILSGKAAAKRGESVVQMNQDFHKQYKEDYEKKQAAAQK